MKLIEIISSSYCICIEIALIINMIVSAKILSKTNTAKEIMICLILENIGIVLGAKLLSILTNIDEYMQLHLLDILTKGFSYWGAILGGIAGIFLFSEVNKKDFVKLLSVFLPNMILIYAISKIGCYLNECCEGIFLENGKQIPIQLIESVTFFAIYIYIMTRKYENPYKKIYVTGMLFCIVKFILEFFRIQYTVMPISISQTFAIYFMIILIIVRYKTKNK